ncbi:hypothetical protein [Hymenobacter norwichensis]|uniref:hypothetical protein n=1 Tax=Hymenobacter norwichensis TaxID=223903 RepID=UPI0005252B96|nr:hypothetical protein [Hymenobacter norwichensis]
MEMYSPKIKALAWVPLVGMLPLFGQAQTTSGSMPALQQLYSTYAVHGVPFGTSEGTVPSLQPQVSGIGKRWKITRVYGLISQADTATFAHEKIRPQFWFRGGRFIGVTYQLKKEQKTRVILQALTRRYGPPKPGNVEGAFYWLGKRTYILYEDALPDVALHIASLGMLNEQVIETSVRQEARTSLGWQPDSLGLPRQFPLPTEKKKK